MEARQKVDDIIEANQQRALTLELCHNECENRLKTINFERTVESFRCQKKLEEFCQAFATFQDKHAEREACRVQQVQLTEANDFHAMSFQETKKAADTTLCSFQERRQAALEASKSARMQCDSGSTKRELVIKQLLRTMLLNNLLSQGILQRLLDCNTKEQTLIEKERAESEQKLEVLMVQGSAPPHGYGSKQIHRRLGMAQDEVHECINNLKGCEATRRELDADLVTAKITIEEFEGLEAIGVPVFVRVTPFYTLFVAGLSCLCMPAHNQLHSGNPIARLSKRKFLLRFQRRPMTWRKTLTPTSTSGIPAGSKRSRLFPP